MKPDDRKLEPSSATRLPVAIAVRRVTKTYPSSPRESLHDVSFTIPHGEFVALVGRSGAGKSTLLRHLNGLVEPTSGTVHVLGRSVTELTRRQLRELRREVGFVFQQFNIVPQITCVENVLAGCLGRLRAPRVGYLSYPAAMRSAAMEQLSRVGLADRAHQRASTLSGGEQQRIAIARSLMQQPRLLLADEPVASLDAASASNVLELLLALCREDSVTMLSSIHQVDLALDWADRFLCLREGRLVLDIQNDGPCTRRVLLDNLGQ